MSMFSKLKSLANDIFSKVEDSIQNLEPLEDTPQETDKENTQAPLQETPNNSEPKRPKRKKKKVSIFSNFTQNNNPSSSQKFLDTPDNVWDVKHLDMFYSEKKIKTGMDQKFYRLVSEYGRARRYFPPDVDKIKEFIASCHDIKLMIEAMKMQRDRQKEIEVQFCGDFFAKDFKDYSGTDWKGVKGKMLVVKEFQKMPHHTFKNRDYTEINRVIAALVQNRKSIVKKMTRNNMKNSDKYFRSFNTINLISKKGEGYIEKVEKLRNSLKVIKQASGVKNLKVTKSFSKKLSRKKALYILKKIRDKYSTSIKYAFNGFRIIPFKNFPDIYKVFAATLIILKTDIHKYSELKILRNLKNCLETKLSMLRRKMEFQLTGELKKFRDSGMRKMSKEFEMVLKVYRRVGSEAVQYSRKKNGGFLKKDCELIWKHYEVMSKRDESLGNFRIENRIRNWFREMDLKAEGGLRERKY